MITLRSNFCRIAKLYEKQFAPAPKMRRVCEALPGPQAETIQPEKKHNPGLHLGRPVLA